jgi:hypothetical protein
VEGKVFGREAVSRFHFPCEWLDCRPNSALIPARSGLSAANVGRAFGSKGAHPTNRDYSDRSPQAGETCAHSRAGFYRCDIPAEAQRRAQLATPRRRAATESSRAWSGSHRASNAPSRASLCAALSPTPRAAPGMTVTRLANLRLAKLAQFHLHRPRFRNQVDFCIQSGRV